MNVERLVLYECDRWKTLRFVMAVRSRPRLSNRAVTSFRSEPGRHGMYCRFREVWTWIHRLILSVSPGLDLERTESAVAWARFGPQPSYCAVTWARFGPQRSYCAVTWANFWEAILLRWCSCPQTPGETDNPQLLHGAAPSLPGATSPLTAEPRY